MSRTFDQDGKGFMPTYQIAQQAFEGPLEVLLQSIEEKKLEISDVSLSMVTEEFLRHLDTLRAAVASQAENQQVRGSNSGIDIRILVDFISVASRLILIKSKSLIPEFPLSHEEEVAIDNLKERLAMYQKIKPAVRIFAKTWNAVPQSCVRSFMKNLLLASPKLAEANADQFFPGGNVNQQTLHDRLEQVLGYWQKMKYEVRTVHERIISLEEHIRGLSVRLQHIEKTKLSALAHASNKTEVVLTFLAILHLAREQIITLEQSMHFSDIIISRHQSTGASDSDTPPTT
jgi:segregation and condensation protein A